MIVKGEIWKFQGATVEWMQDMNKGAPITFYCMKIDGKYPKPGDVIPQWMLTNGILQDFAPEGVEVLLPEGMAK